MHQPVVKDIRVVTPASTRHVATTLNFHSQAIAITHMYVTMVTLPHTLTGTTREWVITSLGELKREVELMSSCLTPLSARGLSMYRGVIFPRETFHLLLSSSKERMEAVLGFR